MRNYKVKNRHTKKLNGALDVTEFEASFLKIVKIIQSEEIAEDIAKHEKGKVLKSNRIQNLNRFMQKTTLYDLNFHCESVEDWENPNYHTK